MIENASAVGELPSKVRKYAIYLLVMAGLGGLIYGIDVGVCAAAYPYIEKTSTFTQAQLGFIVGAVLWGSVVSSLFAGSLAEIFGRKKLIIVSALFFTLSIPVICASGLFEGGSFWLMTLGRTLQGMSAGLVGVVVPMYLAECLAAESRGKGTGMFQLLLTIGLVFAAIIGLLVTTIVGAADAATVSAASKTTAWQTIFWCSAVPGLVLFLGAFKLKESPRWLYKKGRKDEALESLAANNGEARARQILDEMIAADEAEAKAKAEMKAHAKSDTLFQRKYIYPFCLAIVILACNQTTGINSVLNYSVKIFQEIGLHGVLANYSDLSIKLVNMIMTVVAIALVDRMGRKFLLKVGTLGIIVGLCGVGFAFLSVDRGRVDVTQEVRARLAGNACAKLSVDEVASGVAAAHPGLTENGKLRAGVQLIVSYKQGGTADKALAEYFDRGAELRKLAELGGPVYEDDAMAPVDPVAARAKAAEKAQAGAAAPKPALKAADRLALGEIPFAGKPSDKAAAVQILQKLESNSDRIILNPVFASGTAAAPEPLEIASATVGVRPSVGVGLVATLFFFMFIAFYGVGPGVCVWLALSELMPTRIRATGMSIAMIINQGVSATIATVFPAWVVATNYQTVFFCLAGFTVVYFVAAAFFLPETKGRTLEQIEQYFTTGKMPEAKH